MHALHFDHDCSQGGPKSLPVTWDPARGGARVSCPICGVNKLTASIRGHSL